MVVKHVQATPVPPSQRTELPIPADLERVVMACLEKKPGARPASARKVATMLAECDLPPWTEQDATDWWDQHLPETSSLRVVTGEPAQGTTREAFRVEARA
jgi:serine/threonine-protein kinase